MEPVKALIRLGGVARWSQLKRLGVSRDHLWRAIQEGCVVRPHRGVFALPDTPPPDVLASIFRAKPACVSALTQIGLPLYPPPERCHLVVPQTRGLGNPRSRPVDKVHLHRTNGVRTAADHLGLATDCVEPRQLLALVDAALNQRVMNGPEFEALCARLGELGMWLWDRADARAESISETYARLWLGDAGLLVEPQVAFVGVGTVDLVVEGVVVVELDGYAYHSGQAEFRRDRERDRELQARGLDVLRYTFLEVMEGVDIVGDVTQVLWRRGALTPALRTKMNAAARVSLRAAGL